MTDALLLPGSIAKVKKTYFTTSGDTVTVDPEVVVVFRQVLFNKPAYRVVASTSFTNTSHTRNAYKTWIVDGEYILRFSDKDWDTRRKDVSKAGLAFKIFKASYKKDLKDDLRWATRRSTGSRKPGNKGSKGTGRDVD